MTDQEILDNAPEGATHIDDDDCYIKEVDYEGGFASRKVYFNWGEGWKFTPIPTFNLMRSLADIKHIVELEKELDVEYVPYCSNMSISANSVVEMVEHIAELEDLAQMIIDAESADPRVILLMYNAWLLKAKSLKEQGE